MQRSAVWEFNNMCPYKASALVTHDRHGSETLIVVVKATFEFDRDGRVTLAAMQSDPTLVPRFANHPASSSLLADSDFVPAKSGTDVLLFGSAHAPNGRATPKMTVFLRVGGLEKRLSVVGDRSVKQDPFAAGVPFVTMPIVYERAHGGAIAMGDAAATLRGDPRNPAGTGFKDRAGTIGLRWPNIYPVEGNDTSDTPAGFGPIARHWQARSRYGGTYDAQWQRLRSPYLPDDFDDRFYRCAPIDQQSPGFLGGGEPVELVNLTPEGRVAFRLPRVPLKVFATIDGEVRDAAPALHTVTLSTDRAMASLVWHCAFPCAGLEEAISDISVIRSGGHVA